MNFTQFLKHSHGFRLYNPGISRFLSVDPLSPDYPMLTPYQFASNTPISAIDLDGLEAATVSATGAHVKGGGGFVVAISDGEIGLLITTSLGVALQKKPTLGAGIVEFAYNSGASNLDELEGWGVKFTALNYTYTLSGTKGLIVYKPGAPSAQLTWNSEYLILKDISHIKDFIGEAKDYIAEDLLDELIPELQRRLSNFTNEDGVHEMRYGENMQDVAAMHGWNTFSLAAHNRIRANCPDCNSWGGVLGYDGTKLGGRGFLLRVDHQTQGGRSFDPYMDYYGEQLLRYWYYNLNGDQADIPVINISPFDTGWQSGDGFGSLNWQFPFDVSDDPRRNYKETTDGWKKDDK